MILREGEYAIYLVFRKVIGRSNGLPSPFFLFREFFEGNIPEGGPLAINEVITPTWRIIPGLVNG